MTRSFILLLAMMSADSVVKHLRIEDLMEDLIELQVAVGSSWIILFGVISPGSANLVEEV